MLMTEDSWPLALIYQLYQLHLIITSMNLHLAYRIYIIHEEIYFIKKLYSVTYAINYFD